MLQEEIIEEIKNRDKLQAFEIIAATFSAIMDDVYLSGVIPYGEDITNNLDAAHSYLRRAINGIKNGK